MHAERRQARSRSSAPAETQQREPGRRSTPAMKRPHGPSSRGRPRKIGMRPRSTLSPSRCRTAGSTVSEPTIAARTTIIVPSADRREERVARDEHPGHRDQHGRARRSAPPAPTCAPRVAGRSCGVRPASPLLALAPQVEERVVDPDRHADHQDDRAERLLVGRDDVADEAFSPVAASTAENAAARAARRRRARRRRRRGSRSSAAATCTRRGPCRSRSAGRAGGRPRPGRTPR